MQQAFSVNPTRHQDIAQLTIAHMAVLARGSQCIWHCRARDTAQAAGNRHLLGLDAGLSRTRRLCRGGLLLAAQGTSPLTGCGPGWVLARAHATQARGPGDVWPLLADGLHPPPSGCTGIHDHRCLCGHALRLLCAASLLLQRSIQPRHTQAAERQRTPCIQGHQFRVQRAAAEDGRHAERHVATEAVAQGSLGQRGLGAGGVCQEDLQRGRTPVEADVARSPELHHQN